MKFRVPTLVRFCFIGYLLCNLFFLSGCNLIGFVGVTTASVGSVATYGVYKGGEKVVKGTGKLLGIKSSEEKKASIHDAKFKKGVYYAYHTASLKNLYEAGHKALKEMQFRDINGGIDTLSGRLEATTVDEKMILITISTAEKYKGKRELHIRVGSKGNEQISKMIYHKIIAHFDSVSREDDDSGKTYYSRPDTKKTEN